LKKFSEPPVFTARSRAERKSDSGLAEPLGKNLPALREAEVASRIFADRVETGANCVGTSAARTPAIGGTQESRHPTKAIDRAKRSVNDRSGYF
jgi:hypothetical protein